MCDLLHMLYWDFKTFYLFQELQEKLHLVSTSTDFLNASTTSIKYWYIRISLSTMALDIIPTLVYSQHPKLVLLRSSSGERAFVVRSDVEWENS